jgi:hypothetical protein
MKVWRTRDEQTLLRLQKEFLLYHKGWMSVIVGSNRNRIELLLEDGTKIYVYLSLDTYGSESFYTLLYYYPDQPEYVYHATLDSAFVDELRRTIAEEAGEQPLFGWEQAPMKKWSVDGTWDVYE